MAFETTLPDTQNAAQTRGLTDGFGRHVRYLRLSVTDRCDLRCSYCMPERMQFLPRSEVLTLEEMYRLARTCIERGVRKIRLTGGEPLVRRDVLQLVSRLGKDIGSGLDELTMTTNATQLERFAGLLAGAGVKRLNISLDTLNPQKFSTLTRRDAFTDVMAGIDAADKAGLKIKINTVALKGMNEAELPDMIAWAHSRGFDLTLIEVMPLGDVSEDRIDHYLPLPQVRAALEDRWTLTPSTHDSGGPARYVDIAETGGRLGMITPLTNNFCSGCNRVRVTATGQLYMCLGQSDKVDLRAALRGDDSDAALNNALDRAMQRKPEKHDFRIDRRGANPALARHMSVTGG